MSERTLPEIAPASRYPRGRTILIGVIVFVSAGAAAVVYLPGLLLDYWVPNLTPAERGRLLGNVTQIVLFALGGIIAVVGVGLSLARHGEALRAAARDDARDAFTQKNEDVRRAELAAFTTAESERTLRERFVVVVDMVRTGDSATTRIAGLYALAHLADDWIARNVHSEAQVCIDVLCSYLRAPLADGVTTTSPAECEVKLTGFNLIEAHLSGGPVSWDGFAIDLHGAFIDFDVDLSRIRISRSGSFTLRASTITGSAKVYMQGFTADDHAAIDLREVSVTGNAALNLNGARFTGSTWLAMNGLTASADATISLVDAVFDGNARVDGDTVAATETSKIYLTGITIAGHARAHFGSVVVKDQARLWCRNTTVTGHANVTVYGIVVGADAKLHTEGSQIVAPGTFLLGGGV